MKGPLVSTASALPDFTSPGQDSTSAEPSASKEALPAVASSEALPTESNPKPKGPPEVKAPPTAKAPPTGAQAQMSELMNLRPFLCFGADIDSDVAKATFTPAGGDKAAFTPPARSSSLPKSSLKPRSKSRASSRAPSRAPSQGPGRSQTPKRVAKSPPRQEEVEAHPKRKKTVGVVSSTYFYWFYSFRCQAFHPSTSMMRCPETFTRGTGREISWNGPQEISARAGPKTPEHL